MKNWASLKIALDFDETYTAHPDMWEAVVEIMKACGSDVKFVTYRYANAPGNADIEAAAVKMGIEIIYCNYFQKAQVTAIHGWIPDIWIDDMPILIPMKQQLQGMLQGIERSDSSRSQDEIKEMTKNVRALTKKCEVIADRLGGQHD